MAGFWPVLVMVLWTLLPIASYVKLAFRSGCAIPTSLSFASQVYVVLSLATLAFCLVVRLPFGS